MGAVDGNHEGAAAAVLADELRHEGIEGHKGYGAARFLRRVVDARAFGAEAGNVYAAAAAVAVRAGQLSGAVEDAFDIVFRRRHDVAVRQGDFLAFVFQSAVGQNAAAEEEFLLLQQLRHVFVMAADAVNPLLKGFAVVAVLVFPNIHAQLILFAQPFLLVHETPSYAFSYIIYGIVLLLLILYIVFIVIPFPIIAVLYGLRKEILACPEAVHRSRRRYIMSTRRTPPS